MNEALVWGAIVAGAGSLIAVAKFWIDLGKLWQRAEDAAERGNLRDARYDLMSSQFSDFKVEVAQNYATSNSLADVERQTSRAIEQSMTAVNQSLAALTARIDSLLVAMAKQHSDHH